MQDAPSVHEVCSGTAVRCCPIQVIAGAVIEGPMDPMHVSL